jgi:cytochrome c peroxidase
MMRTWNLQFLVMGVAAFAAGSGVTRGAELEISVRPTWVGAPLALNSWRYVDSGGDNFSITRLSYLLSGFAFERMDGSWLELTNQFAWMDAEKERTSVKVIVPADEYRSLRIHVGLDANANHADAAQFAVNHALNPNLNGLHWSWQGGYVFLALEGLWRKHGALDGFSYHLARDTNRVRIQLQAPLYLTNDARLELDFDLADLLGKPRALAFGKDGSSTHSREGDSVATALATNLAGAFRVRRVEKAQPMLSGNIPRRPLDLPAKFTPYRFATSAGFPIPDLPRDNPLIEERVALGRKLFHETLLSRDGTISCASCHDSRAAFSDARRFSVGVSKRMGTRQAMPLFNLAWKNSFFWDGRAPALRAQALMPIQDHMEMDESLTNIVAKLGRTGKERCADGPPYESLFAQAFGSQEITAERIGLALEQFLLTLTSFDSKFDRALQGEAELSQDEKRGLDLFMTEYDPRRQQFGADCFHCHGGPLFQSQAFANNGLDSQFADAGRARVTGRDSDAGKFATPSLRNIALTAPYMHDGRFATLEEVVAHYSSGVKRSGTLDPNIAKHPEGGLHLSADDQRALVVFLRTLTDEKFQSRELSSLK